MKKEFKPHILLFLLFITSSFAWISCDSNKECDQTTDIYSTAFLYTIDETETPADINALSANNFTLFAAEKASDLLIDNASGVQGFNLPLNPQAVSTAFVLNNNGVQDTIVFSHTPELHMISVSCGFTYFFTIHSVVHTENGIHSVTITDSIVDIYERENISIYYN